MPTTPKVSSVAEARKRKEPEVEKGDDPLVIVIVTAIPDIEEGDCALSSPELRPINTRRAKHKLKQVARFMEKRFLVEFRRTDFNKDVE